jgi:hypothetical protein
MGRSRTTFKRKSGETAGSDNMGEFQRVLPNLFRCYGLACLDRAASRQVELNQALLRGLVIVIAAVVIFG